MLDEGCLQRVQIVAFGKTFDGGDGVSVMHHRERQAGVDAAPLDQHRAGAALTVIAAFLGARQREMLTQRIEQCGAGVQRQRMRAAVDLKFDLRGSGGGLLSSTAPAARTPRGSVVKSSAVVPVSITARRVSSIALSSGCGSCSSMTAPYSQVGEGHLQQDIRLAARCRPEG
jgi:hypothetical protein